MKQLIAFVLLVLFLYNLVGFYPAYTWRQHQFREQAERQRRAHLPDQALVRVRVARTAAGEAAPQWQEKHEFRWRGQLYDVVRQQASADSITYFCWHDQGEEKLLAGLHRHVEELTHPNPEAGKTAKKLLDHLFKLALLPAPAAEPGRVLPRQLLPHHAAAAGNLPPRTAAVVVPPPEPRAAA
ncbi:hypothetical protein E5K00_07160 [Hymenobacter aquaticus]|uniref:Uncharacterized protein n=1 Tax=Hymenobacter aquaticus TaxID=1867101 RepID=A0A4Z0Q8E7_9BACT|nr:hypothetical protein [Hymenobacter aquaticus]TGE24972.1 hypothetical protein E5K00_07160 [Hymenobacter aquaticus]